MATSAPTAKVETRTWVLQAETELRFDVSAEHTLTVVVSFIVYRCIIPGIVIGSRGRS